MNIEMHVFFQTMVFSGYMPRSGTAGSYGNSMCSFDLHFSNNQRLGPSFHVPIGHIDEILKFSVPWTLCSLVNPKGVFLVTVFLSA